MRRRNKAAGSAAAGIFLFILALALTVVTVVLIIKAIPSRKDDTLTPPVQQTVPEPVTPPAEPQTSQPFSEPTAEPVSTPEPTAEPEFDPLVPEQASEAPVGYFENAAFLGNSVVTGLDFYDYTDRLSGAVFFAENSLTVLGVDSYLDQMKGQSFGKIYVGLGLNEMSYEREAIRSAFESMVQRLQNEHPDAIVYLMAVTPVSAYKSANDVHFTRELTVSLNELIRDVAKQYGVYYMDDFTILAGADGYLPSEVTSDGVHFTPAHYELWFDYLMTHYIPA